jgi:tryptophan synthase alpha chain
VTGERAEIERSVHGMVTQVKQHTSTPVAVGFGISTPEQAAEVAGYADGVIVGSAIVRLIGALGDTPETVSRVGALAHSLSEAVKKKATA